MAGIYIHIPFCKSACYYCDFHFATSQRLQEPLVAALQKELVLQKDYLKGEAIQTIYFGGGTPSLLNRENIASLLATIQKNYKIASAKEITLEANPDDLTLSYAKALFEEGINRLSIGVQSFQEQLLKKINRIHSSEEALTAISNAQVAGFSNWSLDLMYGLPGSTAYSWEQDLKKALSLAPPHISAYALTIESATYFGRLQAKGQQLALEEELFIEQYQTLVSALKAKGYEQYEISNFSLPNHRSQHNSNYWRQLPYLGIGPSAHSYNGHQRHYNIKHNRCYIEALAQGRVPRITEKLTTTDQINSYILTSLRTVWGVDNHYLIDNFKYNLLQEKRLVLLDYIKRKLIKVEKNKLYLTCSGKLLADAITQDLFKNKLN